MKILKDCLAGGIEKKKCLVIYHSIIFLLIIKSDCLLCFMQSIKSIK